MKNLTLMEQYGVVERTDVRSDMGPNRALYSPSTEFTLIVDMRTHVFSAKLIGSEEPTGTTEGDMESRLEEIDKRIAELDLERSRLLSERSSITDAMRAKDGKDDADMMSMRTNE